MEEEEVESGKERSGVTVYVETAVTEDVPRRSRSGRGQGLRGLWGVVSGGAEWTREWTSP